MDGNLDRIAWISVKQKDGRLNLIKKCVTQRLATCLHLLHALTSLASMESLVFWAHTVAHSANVDGCCSGVRISESFSSDVNSDAAASVLNTRFRAPRCGALRIPHSETEKRSTQFFLCKVVVCAKTVPSS